MIYSYAIVQTWGWKNFIQIYKKSLMLTKAAFIWSKYSLNQEYFEILLQVKITFSIIYILKFNLFIWWQN